MSSTLNTNRGSQGDEGHFVAIDGRAVFIKDDIGTGAKGRGGKFTRHAVEKRLIDHHERHGGGDANSREHDRMQETSGGKAFTFHKALPTEVKEYIDENPAARRLFTVTNDPSRAGGEDAMHEHGDRYWHMADELAGNHAKAARETAKASDDPEMRFLAHLHHDMEAGGTHKGQQGILQAKHLRHGQSFTINGRTFTVEDDPHDGMILDGGPGFPTTPVAALSEIPIDRHSLKAGSRPKTKPNDDIPFSQSQPADAWLAAVPDSYDFSQAEGVDFSAGDKKFMVWKTVVTPGDFVHPNTGQRFSITGADLDTFEASFAEMSAYGDLPAILSKHDEMDGRAGMGVIKGVRRHGDKLQMLHQFADEESLKAGMRANVSPRIRKNYQMSNGRVLPWAIPHVAVTTRPVLPLPNDWEILAARGGDSEAPVFTYAAPTPKGKLMLTPEQLERAKKLEPTVTEDNFADLLLSRAEQDEKNAEKDAADLKELNRQIADLKSKQPAVLNLSASERNMGRRLLDSEVERTFAKQPRAVIDAVKQYVTDNTDLMLSGAEGQPDHFAGFLKLVAALPLKEGLAASGGEQTGVQLHDLSRAVPDAANDETQNAIAEGQKLGSDYQARLLAQRGL